MSDPRDRQDDLGTDLRALADKFEAGAEPEARVVARLQTRRARPRVSLIALVAAAAVVLVAVIGLRPFLTSPAGGPLVFPELDGLFRSVEPDANGRCVAVLVYDTTKADGRVAMWAWTGTNGCEGRSSNLTMATGTARVLVLPRVGGAPERAGIEVTAQPGAAAPLAGLVLVLDPLAAAKGSGSIPGYASPDDINAGHTLDMLAIPELDIPYQPT